MTEFQLPHMTQDEIDKVLQNENLCRIAYLSGDFPYISPFQYVYWKGALYFHFTDYGRKKSFLDQDPKVCVEIEQITPDLSRYCFISLRGRLEKIVNPIEKREIIKEIIDRAQLKFSANFLAAHGFTRLLKWDELHAHQELTIVKLVQIIDTVGLKSP